MEVDAAGDEVAEPDPEEQRRLEEVGADDLGRGQRVGDHHQEPEEGARADGGEADDKPPKIPIMIGDHLVVPHHQERRVVAARGANERLDEVPYAADQRA